MTQNGDEADAQVAAQEHLQQFLEPRLKRAEQAYNQALKSLWLGNAGAALAMLSFVGANWRSGASSTLLVPLGFFVSGLITMGIGELITLVTEGRAIRRIQSATSILDLQWGDIQSPAEEIGLHLSPRTILALMSGGCFVMGAIVGFTLIYVAL